MVVRSSREHRLALALGAGVLLVGLLSTFQQWRAAQLSEAHEAKAALELEASDIESLVRQRMVTYEQVLRGGRGLFAASHDVGRDQFREYVAAQQVWDSYPGIQGIGFSQVVSATQLDAHLAEMRHQAPNYRLWPEGVRDVYTSIVFLEPFEGRNLRAFGFDMFSEPVRRAAMERARDTGRAALSGRVTLVQETTEDIQPGTLLYIPVYGSSTEGKTVDERRAALVGWVYAPFRMHDLMAGVLGRLTETMRVQVFDGDAPVDAALLYDSEPHLGALPTERSSLRRLEVAGARWTLAISPLRSEPTWSAARLLAFAGMSASFALALLVWSLATARARALARARAATEALAARQQTAIALAAARKVEWTCDAATGQVTFGTHWPDVTGLPTAPSSVDAFVANFVAEDRPDVLARVQACVSGQVERVGFDARLSHPLRPRWVRISGAITARGAKGEVERVAGTLGDVDELHSLQEQLVATSRLASMGTLAAGVAHELNNPLTWIQNDLTLAVDQVVRAGPIDRSSLQHLLEEALAGTERITTIVKAMRSLGRPERVDAPVPLDVRSELLQAAQMVRGELNPRARLVLDVPPHLPPVTARQGELGRVFLNLLINAAQAIAPGRPEANVVRCAATVVDGRLQVTVSDTGVGIAPDALPRIFDPFFTTKPVGQGTGLGLSMARSIIDAAGGSLTVDSQLGHGTTFTVRLPVATLSLESLTPIPSPAPPRRRLLLIDDEPRVAQSMAWLLETSHDVTTLDSAEEALRRIDEGERWDAMLVDLMMPGADGIDLYQSLQRRHPTLLPRLAFLTGGAFGERATTFLETHEVEVLAKPATRALILETVERLATR